MRESQILRKGGFCGWVKAQVSSGKVLNVRIVAVRYMGVGFTGER